MKKCFKILVLSSFVLIMNLQAADWRFPIHINYVQGLSKIMDIYTDNLEAQGYIIEDKFFIPIGASFNPYLQFDFGLRVGGGIGPAYIGLFGDFTYFSLPLNVNIGYTLFPNGPVAPYIKTGFMYHLATGDYLKESKPGLFAAAGVSFMNNRRVNFGFEVLTDFSELKFDDYSDYYYGYYGTGTKTIQPGKFMAGVFIQF